MLYKQKIGWFFPTLIEADLHETGFDYTLTQKKFGGNSVTHIFFTYGEITNDRNFINITIEDLKTILIVLVVIFFIAFFGFAINMDDTATRTPVTEFLRLHDALISWGLILGFFALYRTVVIRKMITIGTNKGGHFSLASNEEGEKIINEIITKRNSYLREQYLNDKFAKDYLRIETVEYLSSMKVIPETEAIELIAKIKDRESKKDVGFTQPQE